MLSRLSLSLLLLSATSCLAQTRKNAAVVIGGFDRNSDNGLDKVELFGCEGYDSFEIESYPTTVEMAAGLAWPEGEEQLVVCGGTSKNPDGNGGIVLMNDCYWFDASRAEGSRWQQGEDLPAVRVAHGMFAVNNTDTTSDELVPMVLGQSRFTFIYNPYNGTWMDYKDVQVSYFFRL